MWWFWTWAQTRPDWLAGRTDALGRDRSEPYLSLGVGLSGVSGAERDGEWADVRWGKA